METQKYFSGWLFWSYSPTEPFWGESMGHALEHFSSFPLLNFSHSLGDFNLGHVCLVRFFSTTPRKPELETLKYLLCFIIFYFSSLQLVQSLSIPSNVLSFDKMSPVTPGTCT